MTSRVAMGLVVVAATLLLAVHGGRVPLLDPDESRFARTSVEMLRSGDLVVPRFGGEPRLVKPPLIHWIQSSVFSLAGATPWAARLHALVATLGSILLVAWVARRRFGPEGGVWAAAILASMPLVFLTGRVGTLDALLAVHVFAVVAWDMVEPSRGGTFRPLCVGGLCGLAFLVKGPVGIVLPLLVILAGRTATQRALLPSPGALLQGVAACVAVILPWGLAFLRRVGPGAVGETIRGEVLDRYFAETVHSEPPWFFVKVVAVGMLPWVAPLVVGACRSWSLRKEPAARTAIYAAAGLLAGVLFFSLGQGKLASYILPLAPLAAIVVTWELGREIEAPDRLTLGPTSLAASLAALALLLGLGGTLQLEGAARAAAVSGAAIFAVAAAFAGHAAARRRPRRVYCAAALATAVFFLIAATTLFPELGRRRSSAALIGAVPALSTNRPLVTVEIKVPSLMFYLDRVPQVLEMHELDARLLSDDNPLIVLAEVDLFDVPEPVLQRMREVGRYGKFLVFEKDDAPGKAPELDRVAVPG